MIRHWSFYDPKTGILSGQVFSSTDEEALEANIPDGLAAIEGQHDHLCSRVELTAGEVVDYQPPAPSDEHEWNTDSKRWNLSAPAAKRLEIDLAAHARITHLETNVQPRAVREVALSCPGAIKRLQSIDDEIAELRKQLDKG